MSGEQNRVEKAIAHYDELLAGAYLTSTCEQLHAGILQHHLYFNDKPLCSALRPHMVDRVTAETRYREATIVGRAIVDTVESLLEDRALARAVGVPSYFEDVLQIDKKHGRPSMFARLDGIIDERGTLKIIEYNSEPGFFLDEERIDGVFSGMPIAKEFATRFPFRTHRPLDGFVRAMCSSVPRGKGSRPPTVAVVRGKAEVEPQYAWLADAASRGFQFLAANAEAFHTRGGDLYVEDTRVDFVHVEWPVVLTRPKTLRPVLDALARGSVRAMFGLSRALLCNAKFVLEQLSDPAWLERLDRETAAVVAAHVPWTRRVRECKTTFEGKQIDLVPFVADHREGVVLKPSGSSSGEGVVLGWECGSDHWQETLKHALSRPYVVQERVRGPKEAFPEQQNGELTHKDRFVDFGILVIDGDHGEGHLVRGAHDGLLNVAAGADILARWIIE